METCCPTLVPRPVPIGVWMCSAAANASLLFTLQRAAGEG